MRLHDHADFHPALVDLCAPPLRFRRQPPQLNYPASTVLTPRLRGVSEHRQYTRVVSQRRLHQSQSPGFRVSHLSCARKPTMQCQPIVKLHRVFSSFRSLPGICTRTEISPGLASRQCPDRYTIRAGRNFNGFPLVVNQRLCLAERTTGRVVRDLYYVLRDSHNT